MNDFESQAYLETVLAQGPVGYGFVNREFRFVHVNPRLAEINGIAAGEHLGRTVHEVLGEALWVKRRPLFERALAGEDSVDVQLPGKRMVDGKHRHVLSSYYAVPSNDQIIGVAVVIRDITLQTQAEEALRLREQEYRLLFEANPQPMWVYDL
jgi:PAS domain S-box-containing protein